MGAFYKTLAVLLLCFYACSQAARLTEKHLAEAKEDSEGAIIEGLQHEEQETLSSEPSLDDEVDERILIKPVLSLNANDLVGQIQNNAFIVKLRAFLQGIIDRNNAILLQLQ